MLLSYEEYKGYGGTLDNAAFNMFRYDAEAEINLLTSNRIDIVTENIKLCAVRLINLMSKAEAEKDSPTSFSNDGVSVNFSKTSADDVRMQTTQLIKRYLANETNSEGIPLLYRGVK